MIHHALSEGLLLLRQRLGVSVVLALALAVPIAFAGVGTAVSRWLGPVAELEGGETSVAVLLRPELDPVQRRRWVAEQAAAHPGWTVREIPPDDLVRRLRRWFPYLEDLVGTGDVSLPSLIEITTADLDPLAGFEDQAEVLAVGPRSSVRQLIGRAARRLSWTVAILSAALLAAAILLAAVWVHLELYRHADEVTIMRLVGATEASIRGPFLVAVGLSGAAAGAAAALGSVATLRALSQMVTTLGMPEITASPLLLAAEVTAAVALPVAAAVITLSRHAADEFEG